MRCRPFSAKLATLAWACAWGVAPGCRESAPPDAVPIGLLLSFTGQQAAPSINSERALRLAVDAANAAGGVGGRPVRVMARDTRSDPARATAPARELVEAGAVLFIGPDTPEIAVQLQSVFGDQTAILPSFATASGVTLKPDWWFIMGPSDTGVACELQAQLQADGRKAPISVVGGGGYNRRLAITTLRLYGIPQIFLPADQLSTTSDVQPIVSASADAYVLLAPPPAASSLLFALTAVGAVGEAGRWYLSPTLHTPAFLDNIPKGLLVGAHGVAPGTVAGAADFRASFRARWQDEPLDDAYPFYDAGAVAVLALERAARREGTIQRGPGLAAHVRAVTAAGGTPVQWNELERGLALLRQGQETQYVGLSGPLEFDISGLTPASATKWWTIAEQGFVDVQAESDCRR